MGGIYKDLYKLPRASLGQEGGWGVEHEGRGGEGICLSPTPSTPILQSLGSATLPAPAQGLILEFVVGGRDGRVSSVSFSAPKVFLGAPRQGEGGQDQLEAPGRGQLPLLGPLTLLSSPTAPENSTGDSLCPHIGFAGTEVMTEGDAPSLTPFPAVEVKGTRERKKRGPGPWRLRARGRWRCG